MRFADLAEVEARAKELGDITRAWCVLKSPAAKPKARATR
jgi:hypothetical protein